MRFILYLDSLRQWRWRLAAANGRVLADSGEGYHNKGDAIHAINLIRGGPGGPPIIEG